MSRTRLVRHHAPGVLCENRGKDGMKLRWGRVTWLPDPSRHRRSNAVVRQHLCSSTSTTGAWPKNVAASRGVTSLRFCKFFFAPLHREHAHSRQPLCGGFAYGGNKWKPQGQSYARDVTTACRSEAEASGGPNLPFEQGFDDADVAASRSQVQRRVSAPVPGVDVDLHSKRWSCLIRARVRVRARSRVE